MKKMDYLAPEMEIIELKNQVAILAGSEAGEAPSGGAGGDD